MAHDPVVFISSTSEDLNEHREQAAKAARASGFSPRMMETFPADGSKPSLQACLEMVAEAEVIVVIVAHRYGWVPDDPSNTDGKSITWLESEHVSGVSGRARNREPDREAADRKSGCRPEWRGVMRLLGGELRLQDPRVFQLGTTDLLI